MSKYLGQNVVSYRLTRGNQGSWRGGSGSFSRFGKAGGGRQLTNRLVICYIYIEEGHLSYDCQKKKPTDHREDHRVELTRVESERDSPANNKDRTIRRKSLLSSVNKRKTNRGSTN